MIDVVAKIAKAAGGLQVVLDRLGCTRQAIHQWQRVPRGRVLELEELTGGKITRHDIRPDLYPPTAQKD